MIFVLFNFALLHLQTSAPTGHNVDLYWIHPPSQFILSF